MNWLKDRKYKITVSLIAGLAAALLAAGIPGQIEKNHTLAWWGVMYPKFCFAQPAEESEMEDDRSPGAGRKVKVSFWLAKALDW